VNGRCVSSGYCALRSTECTGRRGRAGLPGPHGSPSRGRLPHKPSKGSCEVRLITHPTLQSDLAERHGSAQQKGFSQLHATRTDVAMRCYAELASEPPVKVTSTHSKKTGHFKHPQRVRKVTFNMNEYPRCLYIPRIWQLGERQSVSIGGNAQADRLAQQQLDGVLCATLDRVRTTLKSQPGGFQQQGRGALQIVVGPDHSVLPLQACRQLKLPVPLYKDPEFNCCLLAGVTGFNCPQSGGPLLHSIG
jgi:hypothetical protein